MHTDNPGVVFGYDWHLSEILFHLLTVRLYGGEIELLVGTALTIALVGDWVPGVVAEGF